MVKGRSRGFTLIASLLVLVLLSAIAAGLLFMVQGAGQVGSNDLESNQAYYGAESGMEFLTANLAALYQQSQSPTPLQLTALANNTPTGAMIGSMAYQESITWTPDANGNPASHTSVISAGSNAGLTAEIVPLTLNVSALRPGGAAVNMTRGVEVAFIPVFQFGVFSDSDLSYFAGPNFDFQGRVHTNGNLFLAEGNGNSLVLDDKVTAVKEIVRDRLANNFTDGVNYQGGVFVLNKGGGCDGTVAQAIVKATCKTFPIGNASWNGGIPTGAGALNSNASPNDWSTVSNTYFNKFLGNGLSLGVAPLTLPFVQGATSSKDQIQIIRKTIDPAELPGSALGSSREYNRANIRVLLASSQADLHPERGPLGDGQDVDLENRAVGAACPPATGFPVAVTGVGTTRFAMATANAMPNTGAKDLSWVQPTVPANGSACDPWSLVDGWLRVEYRNTAGVWTGITTEWLARGFARGIAPPPAPQTNPVHQNAILIFQQQADRDASGTITAAKDAPLNTIDGAPVALTTSSRFSWYPINFYDPREGFPRDVAPAGMANPACYVNGIMNAVEIDVGNLQKWIQGIGPGASGPLVENTSQNGYLLYFSDRRGMVPDPNATPVANVTTGEYGFEDVINRGSATGTPDNNLEPATYYAFSPEDVDQNGLKDNWGAQPVGWGFGLGAAATTNNPYQSVNCLNVGRQNAVTGARHVLRLIDGGLNNLPYPGAASWGVGGFTVASENPVYIWGNYNSDATDPFWNNTAIGSPTITNDVNHSAASVIADSVTLLSNAWSDLNDMNNTLNLGNRIPTNTYYRLAIAGGKNINFPQPNNCAAACNDFGTDGGVHNFLRYLENWGGVTLSYRGSLVSLYYSQYNTGTFKCCNLVYGAPNRNYYFDSAFLDPTKLPPGTPMLQDVVNLTYWQDFKPY
jgi:type II secretory pathway pseudopilin PulG